MQLVRKRWKNTAPESLKNRGPRAEAIVTGGYHKMSAITQYEPNRPGLELEAEVSAVTRRKSAVYSWHSETVQTGRVFSA